jgi:hypothetical protein
MKKHKRMTEIDEYIELFMHQFVDNKKACIKCCRNLTLVNYRSYNGTVNKTCNKCLDYTMNYKYNLTSKQRIRLNYRSRVYMYLGICTYDYLGCSLDEFIDYIESQFQSGMDWSNYTIVWKITFIKPLNIYNSLSDQEIIKRLHYTNIKVIYKL